MIAGTLKLRAGGAVRCVDVDRLTAAAVGYVRCAATNRLLFQVLFGSGLDKSRHPEIDVAARPVADAFLTPARAIRSDPADAHERGIANNSWVWVTGAESASKTKVRALVTERVGKGVAWMPFHFAGWFEGVDQRSKYPQGTDPIVLGESVNTLTTYGYDPATGMQEPKATLCQIRAA